MRLSKFAAIAMSGLLAAGVLGEAAAAQDQADAGSSDAGSNQGNLSQQLNNPVAALISVPFQFDYNQNIGADDQGSEW
jgi:TRAP-type C4-dicarboxylate transport system substrate-binding protein